MGRQIKRPDLEATSPPFFDLHVGHSAKVLAPAHAGSPEGVFWVKVLEIQDESLLGVITSCDSSGRPCEIGLHDVIEFESRHVFGLF